jgi:hypothetical protein
VLAEGLGALRVAADTRGIPEILDLQPGVLVRREGTCRWTLAAFGFRHETNTIEELTTTRTAARA